MSQRHIQAPKKTQHKDIFFNFSLIKEGTTEKEFLYLMQLMPNYNIFVQMKMVF